MTFQIHGSRQAIDLRTLNLNQSVRLLNGLIVEKTNHYPALVTVSNPTEVDGKFTIIERLFGIHHTINLPIGVMRFIYPEDHPELVNHQITPLLVCINKTL